MSDLMLRHLDAIEATLRLGLLQLEGVRHHIANSQPPPRVAAAPLPERCDGISAEWCAKQSGDAAMVKNFGGTNYCQGCRVDPAAA